MQTPTIEQVIEKAKAMRAAAMTIGNHATDEALAAETDFDETLAAYMQILPEKFIHLSPMQQSSAAYIIVQTVIMLKNEETASVFAKQGLPAIALEYQANAQAAKDEIRERIAIYPF